MYLGNVFLLTLNALDWKAVIHNHIWLALAQLRSKLLKYFWRKRQRNRLKIIAAQALSQVK